MKYLSVREVASLCVAVSITAASWTAYARGAGLDGQAKPAAAAAVAAPTLAPVAIKVTQPPATVSKPINISRVLNEASAKGAHGIPKAAMTAYNRATAWANSSLNCHMPWQLLGGIGLIESNHGNGDGSTLTTQGVSMPGVYGPALNGEGFALIRDSDHGVLDKDTTYDRAVGPMQFIPSTWRLVARSANGTTPNPQNINDAALSAAAYLCAGGRNLSTPPGLLSAIFSYNHSNNYVNAVLGVMRAYGASNLPAALPPDPDPNASPSASASASAGATATAKPTKGSTTTTGSSGGTTTPKPTSTTTAKPSPSPTPTATATSKPLCTMLGPLCVKKK